MLLGVEFFQSIQHKTVLDFGCGGGAEAVEMAQQGATRVIGLDIREEVLEPARRRALEAAVADKCVFVSSTSMLADVIVSLDAFEHFAEPAEILKTMDALLAPEGQIFVSFGPTWYHPLGGHLFSVFPWAHIIFGERALIRWRSRFKADGATKFSEVAGGLNQMTIRKFEKLIASSPFELTSLELVPIRRLQILQSRLTREFTTAIVRCRLTKLR
jgi:SAM-dependent methyltransferase